MTNEISLDSIALKTVLDNLSTMVLIANSSAEIVYANGDVEKVAGVKAHELVGRKFGNVFHCIYDKEYGCGNSEHCQNICDIRKTLVKTIQTDQTQMVEKAKLTVYNGDVLYLNIKAIPLKQLNENYVVVVLEDVEQKIAHELSNEKATKILTLKETGGAIAHELNNPLAVAIGQCSFLIRDNFQDVTKSHDRAQKISTQLEKMASIVLQIDQIIDYKIKHYTDGVKIADLTPQKK